MLPYWCCCSVFLPGTLFWLLWSQCKSIHLPLLTSEHWWRCWEHFLHLDQGIGHLQTKDQTKVSLYMWKMTDEFPQCCLRMSDQGSIIWSLCLINECNIEWLPLGVDLVKRSCQVLTFPPWNHIMILDACKWWVTVVCWEPSRHMTFPTMLRRKNLCSCWSHCGLLNFCTGWLCWHCNVFWDCPFYLILTHELMEMLKKSSLLISLKNFTWDAMLSLSFTTG